MSLSDEWVDVSSDPPVGRLSNSCADCGAVFAARYRADVDENGFLAGEGPNWRRAAYSVECRLALHCCSIAAN